MKYLPLALCIFTVTAVADVRPDPTPTPSAIVTAFIDTAPRIGNWREMRRLNEPTPAPQQQPQLRIDVVPGLRAVPRDMVIPAGTIVDVRLTSTVRTDTYQDGDIIGFEVVQPVVVNGIVVIDKGAAAKGRIVRLEKARTFGRGGNLYFSIYEVSAVNGKRILTDFNYRFKGINDHARTNTELILRGLAAGAYGAAVTLAEFDNAWGVFFAPVALIGGAFRKGDEAKQPKGKQFEIAVRNNTPLEGDEITDSPRAALWDGARPGSRFPALFDRNRVSMTDILNARNLRDLPR